MEQEKLVEIYKNLINMDLSVFPKIIAETKDANEKQFFINTYNYLLSTKQKEVVASGRF